MIRLHYHPWELRKPNSDVYKPLLSCDLMKSINLRKTNKTIDLLTFLLKTPHRLKSLILKLYLSPVWSAWSGLIWQDGSVSGSTPLSSANKGCPLNPSGFLSLATIESLEPILLLEPKVHCISVTEKETIESYILL